MVVIDFLFPNFILTTILDVDFDSHTKCSYKKKQQSEQQRQLASHQFSDLQTKQQLSSMKSIQAITGDNTSIVRRNSSRKKLDEPNVIEMSPNPVANDEPERNVINYSDQLAIHDLKSDKSLLNKHQTNSILSGKNSNLKSTDHRTRRQSTGRTDDGRQTDGQLKSQQVRL